jgi:methyl-accepting chemotaxis protein
MTEFIPQPVIRRGDLVLTEPQERAISVAVRRLGDTLDRLDQLLAVTDAGDGYRTLDRDIDPDSTDRLHDAIAHVRRSLSELAERVGVTTEHQSARATFGALASGAWTVAEDLHPRKLRRYGDVDSDTARTLAPVIESIAAGFLALAEEMNRQGAARASEAAPPRWR